MKRAGAGNLSRRARRGIQRAGQVGCAARRRRSTRNQLLSVPSISWASRQCPVPGAHVARAHTGAAFQRGRTQPARGEDGPPGTEAVDGREPEVGGGGRGGTPCRWLLTPCRLESARTAEACSARRACVFWARLRSVTSTEAEKLTF